MINSLHKSFLMDISGTGKEYSEHKVVQKNIPVIN
jgi:hypothetical protein